MGKYINQLPNGKTLPAKGKAEMLLEEVPGTQLLTAPPLTLQPNLVCVVDNGAFEAAGYCFDEGEFEAFNEPDDYRRKKWLIVPDAESLAN